MNSIVAVFSIIQATKKELCQIKGVSEAKVEKVLEAASKVEVANSFMTGNQLMLRRAQASDAENNTTTVRINWKSLESSR